ncbi:EAL domain-containing protein [Calidifontibacillus erzurumensis]|uniref:EAL domain-containing protein n=1 Tax=Calidifontibacillus erzurumensis TaxID=2741433 RepID=A0A8J8GDM8_9BACI|nr:EAL domain-containing protein [Calidifontibacillus erzurumensis]NSL51737.1 EAL domain-containing protein [Calidifontibacillus erzurumensis]
MKKPFIYFYNKAKKVPKLVYPEKKLRFFPSSFTVRDPKASLVKKAFEEGQEVVFVLFYLKTAYPYNRFLKQKVVKIVQEKIPDDMIISLFHYNSDEIALLVKIGKEIQALIKFEQYIDEIALSLNQAAALQFSDFQIGYMVVEKDCDNENDIKEAIHRAYLQIYAEAEKHLQSTYNEFLYDIQNILINKNIKLLAQPIIDLTSGNIYAYEMLTRGPEHTAYENPIHLFTIARQTDMLYDLELLVMEKAFKQVHDLGGRHRVFINLTPISLGNLQFVEDISSLLEKYPLVNPEQIVIELTERESIDDVQDICTPIRLLREKGFRIAVDDTGAGYASLHTISKVMPDIIKIDRSVIQNIDSDRVKESMLKGLLLIAKETRSLVVAEGIETEEEASVLLKNKVDLAQGFFYAKPSDMQINEFRL